MTWKYWKNKAFLLLTGKFPTLRHLSSAKSIFFWFVSTAVKSRLPTVYISASPEEQHCMISMGTLFQLPWWKLKCTDDLGVKKSTGEDIPLLQPCKLWNCCSDALCLQFCCSGTWLQVSDINLLPLGATGAVGFSEVLLFHQSNYTFFFSPRNQQQSAGSPLSQMGAYLSFSAFLNPWCNLKTAAWHVTCCALWRAAKHR